MTTSTWRWPARSARYPASGPYDLIDGLTGLGIYALARWPRPAAADCLAEVVGQLAGRARADADGVCWPTAAVALPGPRRQLYLGGAVDAGVAHGMAGSAAAARAGLRTGRRRGHRAPAAGRGRAAGC